MQTLYRNTQMGWAIIIPVEIAALGCLYLALAKGILMINALAAKCCLCQPRDLSTIPTPPRS